jgi:hypothetical protein
MREEKSTNNSILTKLLTDQRLTTLFLIEKNTYASAWTIEKIKDAKEAEDEDNNCYYSLYNRG